MTGLPTPARVLIWASIVAGAAAILYRLPDAGGWGWVDAVEYVALVAAIVVAQQFSIELRHRTESEVFSMVDAIWVAGLLLVKPSVLTLAVGTGVLIGQAVHGWTPHKLGFNVGQDLVGVTLALAVYGALSPAADEPLGWVAAALGMAVYFVVNTVSVALVIALAAGERFRDVLVPPLAVGFFQWAGNVALGLLAAVVWLEEPAALPLVAVPLVVSFAAYRGWLRSIRERDLMHDIVRTADAISEQGDLSRRVTVHDGGDVDRLAQTLNRMLDRLEGAFVRERRFLDEASHELRTPITISRGHLEVMSPNPGREELEETVSIVVDELARTSRLLDDMTAVARAHADRFLRRDPVSINGFLADLAAKAALLLDGRLDVRPLALDATVAADSQRLTQALINLLQNAAVHARNGSPVTVSVVEEPGGWRFEVSDEGGGVMVEPVERVFEPFSRGTASVPGSGLGLPIVRSIAEAHGGAAGVVNRTGVGATFWIRLPK